MPAGTVSRRAFLIGLGTGAASASLVWGVWKSGLGARGAAETHAVPECCNYVDYAGWTVTRADKERLTAAASVRRLESTEFQGGDLANRVVQNADACENWCLSEADCQAYSYAKPTHPAEYSRSRCWLKNTSSLAPVKNDHYTSGVR